MDKQTREAIEKIISYAKAYGCNKIYIKIAEEWLKNQK